MEQPSGTGSFCYRPLDLAKKSIRLIEVLRIDGNGVVVCKIRHADVTQRYIALSYVWGPESPHNHIHLIDEDARHSGSLRVRSNLHDFLRKATSTDVGVLFWIDAICIDQQNIKERNHQVRQMRDVYETATEVRIWLGKDSATGEILSAISTVSLKGDIPVKDLFDEQLCPAEFQAAFQTKKLTGLLRNKYWSRTWIVQEILLAGKITVQGAGGTCPWSDLSGLYPPQSVGQSPYMKRLVGNWRAGSDLAMLEDSRHYPLPAVLDAFGETECADIRDRVYGFLALVIDGDKLEVDYAETPAQLFVRATNAFKLDVDHIGGLLSALSFDAKSLFLVSSVSASELWQTQKVLSQIPHILDTKITLPLCSLQGMAPCEWSRSGNGPPCSKCCDAGNRIVSMPECLEDWKVEARGLIDKETKLKGLFSSDYKGLFKEWLCSKWPTFLEKPHSLTEDHCKQCYACSIKFRAQKKRREWEDLKQYVENSGLGNHLPSLDGWLGRSQRNLRARRRGKALALNPASAASGAKSASNALPQDE